MSTSASASESSVSDGRSCRRSATSSAPMRRINAIGTCQWGSTPPVKSCRSRGLRTREQESKVAVRRYVRRSTSRLSTGAVEGRNGSSHRGFRPHVQTAVPTVASNRRARPPSETSATVLSCARPSRHASTTTMAAATTDHRERSERDAHMALYDKRADNNCHRERPEIAIGRGPRQTHNREQRQDDIYGFHGSTRNPAPNARTSNRTTTRPSVSPATPTSPPQHRADASERIDVHATAPASIPRPCAPSIRYGTAST